MIKILTIAGSNSDTSINKKLAAHIAIEISSTLSLLDGADAADVIVLDWNNLKLPLFSPQLEKESGIPEAAHYFHKQLSNADAIVLSVAEHNGNITAALKNLWDWTSRLEQKVWMNKPMFLAATSPGGRGAQSALGIVKNLLPHYGGNLIADYSLPRFHDNLVDNKIKDEAKSEELHQKVTLFAQALVQD